MLCRADEYSPGLVLDKIEDTGVREMVETMLSKEDSLTKHVERVVPDIRLIFLQDFQMNDERYDNSVSIKVYIYIYPHSTIY